MGQGTLHLDLDAKKLSIALQEAGESDFRLPSWTLVCDVFMSHVYRRLQVLPTVLQIDQFDLNLEL